MKLPPSLLVTVEHSVSSTPLDLTQKCFASIVNAYAKYFHSYEESPLLVINTSNVDVNKPDDYSLLLDVIKKDLKGKNYFNPSGI